MVSFRHVALIWLCSLMSVFGINAAETATAQEVAVGVAQTTFVLPKGVPLAGYSRRKGKPSHGVHDPVGVRALVFEDAQTTAALVSADLLIIDEILYDAVHQRLLHRGLPPDFLLLLAATHTHSGPGAYGTTFVEKISMGHFDPVVFESLVQSVTETVVSAYEKRQGPVQVLYRSTRTEGLVRNRIEEGGVIDDTLHVLGIYRTGQSQPVGLVVNFAAHPTTLGAWNWQLSGDYPGVVMAEVERQLPGSMCLFLPGAMADQAPVKSGEGFERAQWIGRALARQAIAALEGPSAQPLLSVSGGVERLRLPEAQVRLGRWTLPRWLGQQLVDDDATVSLLQLGTTVLMGAPCDLSAELGAPLQQRAQTQGMHAIMVGFANDYIGYCVPEALYHAKEYESYMAFNGPKAGELIVDRLAQMLDRVVTSGE